jgi:hypothetical protein
LVGDKNFKKYTYFEKDYLGGLKRAKIRNLCFTGHRIDTSEFLMAMIDITS